MACIKSEPLPVIPPFVLPTTTAPSPITPVHSKPLAKAAPVEPEPPAGPKTKLEVRFKAHSNTDWLFDLLHSRRYYFTQHDDLTDSPHWIVEVPDSEKDAFIAEMKRAPDIVDVKPAVIIEMVVYFQKEIPEKEALRILKQFGHRHHTGADSQRGRVFFEESGPRFIVYVPVAKLEAFTDECSKRTEIKDVYEADWGVFKD